MKKKKKQKKKKKPGKKVFRLDFCLYIQLILQEWSQASLPLPHTKNNNKTSMLFNTNQGDIYHWSVSDCRTQY